MSTAFASSQLILIGAPLLLSWMVGIGFYQNSVVIPNWFNNPPASFAKINQYGKAEIRFWVPMQAITLFALVATLLVQWHEPARPAWVIAAFACYVFSVAITAAYLAPRIIAWARIGQGGVVSEGFAEGFGAAGNWWRALSWRFVVAHCRGFGRAF
jgi:hypothetical protein